MDMYLQYVDSHKRVEKILKNSKPYWNEVLYDLWHKMSIPERTHSKYRGLRHIKEQLTRHFVYHRNTSDKVSY